MRTLRISRLPQLAFQCVRSGTATLLHLDVHICDLLRLCDSIFFGPHFAGRSGHERLIRITSSMRLSAIGERHGVSPPSSRAPCYSCDFPDRVSMSQPHFVIPSHPEESARRAAALPLAGAIIAFAEPQHPAIQFRPPPDTHATHSTFFVSRTGH